MPTDTERTTITLSTYHMKIVKNLIGIMGNTPASVITGIVAAYIDDKLPDIKERIQMKKLILPDLEEIEEKMLSLVESSIKLRIDDLSRFLGMDREILLEQIPSWSKKHNLLIDGDFILKKS